MRIADQFVGDPAIRRGDSALAVTYDAPAYVDLVSVRLTFRSDRPTPVPFRVVREGIVVAEWESPDGEGEFVFAVPPGDAPAVEVLDVDG